MCSLRRTPALSLVFAALVGAACGGSATASTSSESSTSMSTTTTPATVSTAAAIESTTESTTTTPATTASTTTTTSTTTPEPQIEAFEQIDRDVLLTSVIIADSEGNLLGTQLDPQSSGCEGEAQSYYVNLRADGRINPTTATGEPIQFSGSVKPSMRRDQILDVQGCEGFLGAITIFDVTADLELENPVPVDVAGAIAGDASWNPDGFVTMMLTDENAFYAEVVEDGEEPTGPQVDEYLVNPRTGERTQSGTLEQFNFGAVRTADGQLVHVEFGAEPAVVLAARTGDDERRFEASGFRVSPDSSEMVIWDSIFEDSESSGIEVVNLASGTTERVGEGPSLNVIWNRNGSRIAYTSGLETLVYDRTSGETLSVGEPAEIECSQDSFVTWGRVPLAFATNGDLYVGDSFCGVSSEGVATLEYRVHQIVLS